MNLRPHNISPHVVILGAGASIATIPDGDKQGRNLSTMNGFFDTLGYDLNLEARFGKEQSRNLEELYNVADQELKDEMEYLIEEHFKRIKIPDSPTIYDQLLIGLRSKDLVATFNWDPLIIQAYIRNQNEFNLPQIVFLHGNIAVYYCPNHPRKIGFESGLCPHCNSRLVRPNLLYPTNKKDYNQTLFLSRQWEILSAHLQCARWVTIFGYSAPKTDIEAKNLMKKAWGSPQQRALEEIEFIDIKPQEQLDQDWHEFIHSHHRRTHKSFYDSHIAIFPRRTIEAYNEEILLGRILEYDEHPRFNRLEELWDYLRPLQQEEQRDLVSS